MGARGIRVVIVDDHALVAEALADALAREDDLEVVGTAGTLAGALDTVEALAPDVVLMDVRLPDGDGASGTASIRARCPDAAVVILTASSGIDVLARAVEAGAAGLLSKGEHVATLVDAVRRVHAGAVLFQPETLAEIAVHLRQGDRGPGSTLTPREREILGLLAEGASTEAIADRLVLSRHTVRNHVRNVLAKLEVHSKLEAVAVAVRHRLVDLDEG